MTDIAQLDAELNQTILSGNIMEAFERFFHEDCLMQENANEPTRGKEANRQRELDFLDAVEAKRIFEPSPEKGGEILEG